MILIRLHRRLTRNTFRFFRRMTRFHLRPHLNLITHRRRRLERLLNRFRLRLRLIFLRLRLFLFLRPLLLLLRRLRLRRPISHTEKEIKVASFSVSFFVWSILFM